MIEFILGLFVAMSMLLPPLAILALREIAFQRNTKKISRMAAEYVQKIQENAEIPEDTKKVLLEAEKIINDNA